MVDFKVEWVDFRCLMVDFAPIKVDFSQNSIKKGAAAADPFLNFS